MTQTIENHQTAQAQIKTLIQAMASHCIGHEEALKHCLGAFFAGGHVLVEDIPGVGKTTLARTLSAAMAAGFARVQFTPDLMPSDILGVSIFNQQAQTFEFRKGPVFTQIFMADEINRASPKTQSALLEAMEERQVSIDGKTYPLGEPFMVIATQNPIEFEGTFPLPEAQMDRFMIQLSLGYPSPEDEMAIYKKDAGQGVLPELEPLSYEDFKQIKTIIENVHVSDLMFAYVQRLAAQSRKHEYVYYGLSPRAGIALVKMAKFWAFMADRAYVVPEDLRAVAMAVMSHRLVMKPEALYNQHTVKETIEQILGTVVVPKGSFEHGR